MIDTKRVVSTLPELTSFVLAGGLLAVAELDRALFAGLMREDGFAEWASFAAFVAVAVIALVAARRMSGWSLERTGLIALGLFGMLVAGEEISWGQRVLGFRPPDLFLEHNFQQESNLHNLLKGVFETRWMVFLVAAYGVVASYWATVSRFPRALAPSSALLPWLALVAWLELSYPYELVGELAELLLGLTLLREACLRGLRPAAEPNYALRVFRAQLAVLFAGALLLPVNELSAWWQRDALVAEAQRDLDELARLIERGVAVQSELFEKGAIHKRVYTAVRANYLALDPAEYYLDPWNSPYWIAVHRTGAGKAEVVVYSFGSNRRRDLPISRAARLGHGVSMKGDADDLFTRIRVSSARQAAR